MILHIVNKSPFERNALESCLRHLVEGAALLLIEDGVYGSMKDNAFSAKMLALSGKMPIYALQPDVAARGIQDKMLEGTTLVDYGGFVDLVAKYARVISWL